MTDPARRDIAERGLRPEREAREQRQFVRGIDPVDIKARIGLGEPERLCLRQHLGEIAALGLHLGQDEIARPVEDAVNPLNHVGRSTLAQPLDHRHAARDRRLELERDARAFGRARQFQAVMREHRLVRGDKALARAERRARERQRRAVRSADQLDHHVRARLRERGRVVDPLEAFDIDPAILRSVARRHRDDLDRPPRAPRDQRAVVIEQADHASADRAEPGKRDTKWFGHWCGPPSARPDGTGRHRGPASGGLDRETTPKRPIIS